MASHLPNSSQPLRATPGRGIVAASQVADFTLTLDRTSGKWEHRQGFPVGVCKAIQQSLKLVSSGLRDAAQYPKRTSRTAKPLGGNDESVAVVDKVVHYENKAKELGNDQERTVADAIRQTQELLQGCVGFLPYLEIESDPEETLKSKLNEDVKKLDLVKADLDQSPRVYNNHHTGSGAQSLHQGNGPQNVNNGGNFFNGTLSGPCDFSTRSK